MCYSDLHSQSHYLCYRSRHIRVRPSTIRHGLPQHRLPRVRSRSRPVPRQLWRPGHSGSFTAPSHEPSSVLRSTAGTSCQICQLGLSFNTCTAISLYTCTYATSAQLHGIGTKAWTLSVDSFNCCRTNTNSSFVHGSYVSSLSSGATGPSWTPPRSSSSPLPHTIPAPSSTSPVFTK